MPSPITHTRRWFAALAIVVGCSLMSIGCSSNRVASNTAEALTLDGFSTNVFGSGKPLVLIFVSSGCPVANSYAPEIRRLCDKFTPAGVDFRLVYPDPDDTAAIIRQHLQDYALPCAALRDPTHLLVASTGVRVTPEAAVFSAKVVLVYRGRIDDRVSAPGRSRPQATVHDLENVLAEIVAGRTTAQTVTRAIGCYIEDLK